MPSILIQRILYVCVSDAGIVNYLTACYAKIFGFLGPDMVSLVTFLTMNGAVFNKEMQ